MPVHVVLAKRTKILLITALGGAALMSATAIHASPTNVASAAAETAALGSASGANSTSTAADQLMASLDIRPSKVAKVADPASSTALPSVVAAPFGPPGAVGEMGIPLLVFQAYKNAERVVKTQQPSCHLPWWLLAGIGHTESGHAESGRLYADGTTRGRILGPRLDGSIAGDAVILDTDHGVYDGDTVYDRAVGPMQFIPSTWRSWAVDGNGDGKSDPNNIFDATLGSGHYLCAGGRDLATMAGLQAAILSYNNSAPYLQTVLAWAIAYRDHGVSQPNSPLPVISDVTKVRPSLSTQPPKTSSSPTPKTSSSSTSGSPAPTVKTTVPSTPPSSSCPTSSGPSSSSTTASTSPSDSSSGTSPGSSANTDAAATTSASATASPCRS
jgi:membrane-bound lytic murein transglycosylase B